MNQVVWIGGAPAHYTRAFHRRIVEQYGGAVSFIYVGHARSDRTYEVGSFPRGAETVEERYRPGVISSLLKRLRDRGVDRLVVAGHFPRLVGIAGLYGLVKGWSVYYWSDTNLFDVLREPKSRRATTRRILGAYLSRMTALLYVGSRNRDFYTWCTHGRVSPRSMIRLPHAHDHDWFASGYEALSLPRRAELRIAYVGRLIKLKGVDQVIRAMRLLPQSLLKHTVLTVAGDGPCRTELMALAEVLGLSAQVEFLGAIPSSQAREILWSSDVLVLPSYREAWGLVVNEALSAGKPALAPSWIGAAGDILIDGATGVVVGSNEPEDLSAGLKTVLDDGEYSRRLGMRGQALVREQRWSIEGAMDGFAEIVA